MAIPPNIPSNVWNRLPRSTQNAIKQQPSAPAAPKPASTPAPAPKTTPPPDVWNRLPRSTQEAIKKQQSAPAPAASAPTTVPPNVPLDVWNRLPPSTRNALAQRQASAPPPAQPAAPKIPANVPPEVWNRLPQSTRDALLAKANQPPKPSMTIPVPGVSAETWQHLSMQERRDMLKDYETVATTGAPTTAIPDAEGLKGLRRGDWRSERLADNPIEKLHEFLASNGYMERDVEGFGTNYGRRTAAAISQFQKDQGLAVTGSLNDSTIAAMQHPGPRLDERLRGPAATFGMGDASETWKKYGDGRLEQTFENGKLVYGANGVTAYDKAGNVITIEDVIARSGASPEAAAALKFALDQMPGGAQDEVNPNNKKTVGGDPAAWNSWCLGFVASAYGREIPNLQAEDAKASMAKFKAAGALVNDRTNMPPGAPVFFEPTSHNSGYGHIAIYSGEKTPDGDPIIITTGWRGWDGIHKIPLSQLEAKTGAFTGWGLVNPEG